MSSESNTSSAATPSESGPSSSEEGWDIIPTVAMSLLTFGSEDCGDFFAFEGSLDSSFIPPASDADVFVAVAGAVETPTTDQQTSSGENISPQLDVIFDPSSAWPLADHPEEFAVDEFLFGLEATTQNTLELFEIDRSSLDGFILELENQTEPFAFLEDLNVDQTELREDHGPFAASASSEVPSGIRLDRDQPGTESNSDSASTLDRVTPIADRRRQRSPSPAGNIWEKIATSTSCFQVEIQYPVNERPTKKVRGPLPAFVRAKAKDVRRKRACLRCHLQKLSCDGDTPCGQCVRVQGKTRLYRSVCERLNIEDAITFRKGNSKFNQEDAAVRPYPVWVSGKAPRTITLIRPRHIGTRWPKGEDYPTLKIQVQEFIPGPADITAERWRSGSNEVILELPAYASADNSKTTTALLSWVEDNFEYYSRDMVSQPGDFIIGATFDEALRYAAKHPDSIVKTALKIWIGVRMAQEFFSVQEKSDFGIEVVQDSNSIHDGQCPVPPVLDHQLDVLMIDEMAKMNVALLRRFRKMIESRNRHNWFELYLTSFILLSNLQYVYRSQERWWKMHFNTGKENAIGEAYKSISYRFMQRYRFSAKNILSHFRYCLKGPVPFTLDWDKEKTARLGNIDSDAIKYVKYISVNVRRRTPEFQENFARAEHGEFEGDMFWLSQLFLNADHSQ
ncbi:hypothetical protein B0T25DRAFT_560445 [Lasiosphaeria hispida]|uniref:Zn(2)-C6 fungal-type domain-containing protein n=1 Tax=Lasiosphaeria hispida TaxID=260671 RepID=A0AAJ0H505_9PEZI|nr:hypothetical protein B0T25DRAFT_560445 [Lasiosphaeria hispida]